MFTASSRVADLLVMCGYQSSNCCGVMKRSPQPRLRHTSPICSVRSSAKAVALRLPIYVHLAVKTTRHKALLQGFVGHSPDILLMILYRGSHLHQGSSTCVAFHFPAPLQPCPYSHPQDIITFVLPTWKT